MPTPLDLYRVTGRAGNVGTPGAPILDFDLLVNSSAGSISGQAHINQAVAPPDGEIHIHNVTGTVRELVFGGQITLLVALQGTYDRALPPPLILTIVEHFAAHFSVDQKWEGRGSFDYNNGGQVVNNVPVTSTRAR
jgi:Domain of unknown function (DUF1842)